MEPVSAEIWKGFIDALDKTNLEQECDLERVDGVSFVPALGPGFAKYVLRSAGTASVTAVLRVRLRRADPLRRDRVGGGCIRAHGAHPLVILG